MITLFKTSQEMQTNPVALPREPQELQLPQETGTTALSHDPVVSTEEIFLSMSGSFETDLICSPEQCRAFLQVIVIPSY